MIRSLDPPPGDTLYYDLSNYSAYDADQMAAELIALRPVPCLLPDGIWLYPTRHWEQKTGTPSH